MFFTVLFRLLFGYVRFTAADGFTERFINLCSLNSIPLWGLKTTDEGITACTTVNGYRFIRPCAAKAGMRLKVQSRHGLPFFINRYRRRSGVIVGLALFFCIIALLSSMVWTVEINGNSSLTDEEVLSVLNEAGLKTGMFKSELSAPEIRFYALGRMPEISYIAINLKGSCVQAEITERIESNVIPPDDSPCDVVSTMDGQIAVLEVYEGTKMYTVGEAVRQGNVLAAGFAELSNGTVRLRHARAYALIKAEIGIDSKTEEENQLYSLEHREKHTTLHFFGINIPLFIKGDSSPDLTRTFFITAGGTRLPIGYTEQIYNYYAEAESSLTDAQQALCTAENYFENKIEALRYAEVEKENVSVTKDAVSGEFTAIFSAGAAKPTNIEAGS